MWGKVGMKSKLSDTFLLSYREFSDSDDFEGGGFRQVSERERVKRARIPTDVRKRAGREVSVGKRIGRRQSVGKQAGQELTVGK